MIETCAKQQVMDMVLIRLERTAMLFDTRQTDTNGIEDRYGQYANCNCRRGIPKMDQLFSPTKPK